MRYPQMGNHFPDYPQESLPAIPEGWTDLSWKNDSSPSFDTATGYHVFVDYADPAQRENGGDWPRFSVIGAKDDYCSAVLVTDDWQEVLELVRVR